jgi:outer membrane lipoprotein-sorting protein
MLSRVKAIKPHPSDDATKGLTEMPEISVTDPNLVGWWKFDGNANDSSGNGNNGAEKGDPTYVAGKIGQAISFDGRGDRIEVPATFAGNPELYPAKAISISAWVRTTVPASTLCSMIRHEFHFTPLQTFADSAWAVAFTGRYGFMVRRRSGFDWSKINDGKWHYCAITYNNGIHEVWIDGTKEVSENYGPFPLWTGDDQPWVFGGKERGEGGGEYYPGELDDVRIYNCALSKGEITTLYNEGKEVIKEDEAANTASKDEIPNAVFEDESEARVLYEKMIETMRNAESLSYTSNYRWESKGREIGRCTYTTWMKKPNYFRVETVNSRGVERGILVGDGDYLWIYWPGDRPHFSSEETEDYVKTRSEVYMKEATPLGKHSIGHKTSLLGAGMSMPIIDPSTFHGYTDSLQPYIDWIRGMGTEKVGDEECDVIEVSIMKHQRSWYLWLSKQDHLPRKMKQVVRVAYDIIMHEQWREVTINAEIPTEKFAWVPPEGWQQWRLPGLEERLLKPGQDAPDFELLTADGSKVKMSDYRGKVVWFYIWRAG